MEPVKNNLTMKKNIILTGPNASGKTTILKSTLINIIVSQQWGCGFYTFAKFRPFTHIHSYLNIPDSSGRDSLFQAESRRCKEILDIVNHTDNKKTHHFCIFDELYSGTNYKEATKSAAAFLKYLSKFDNVEFILTTHYRKLCKHKSTVIENYKMDVIESGEDIQYTYRMKRGVSKVEGGIRILKQMNYPSDILAGL
jgi:DNA mismatch repair ATPase MutS